MALPKDASTELGLFESKNSSILLWITLALVLGTAGTLYAINDKIGAIVMIPLAFGAFFGHRSGAWKMLSVFIGSVCGYYLAAPTAARLVPLIEEALGRSISNSALELGVSGFVAGIAVMIVLLCFGWLVISRIRLLRALDKDLGIVIGVSKSLALVVVSLWTVLALEPRMIEIRGKQPINGESAQANLYHQFLNVADATRKSPILSCLSKWNPIATNPQLNELLNKSQAMVLKVQSQVMAAQSMPMGGDAKLTGLFTELQSQSTGGVSNGFRNGANVNDTLSSGGLGAMLQKLVDGKHP
jgi:uncharacterized membrane protein required for colicin V production